MNIFSFKKLDMHVTCMSLNVVALVLTHPCFFRNTIVVSR